MPVRLQRITQFIAHRSSNIGEAKTKAATQPYAMPKQVDRHFNFLTGLFRTMMPHHSMGRSPEFVDAVEARVEQILQAYLSEHPDATEEQIKKGGIARLCRARQEVFQELPAEEQNAWRQRAKKDRGGEYGEDEK